MRQTATGGEPFRVNSALAHAQKTKGFLSSLLRDCGSCLRHETSMCFVSGVLSRFGVRSSFHLAPRAATKSSSYFACKGTSKIDDTIQLVFGMDVALLILLAVWLAALERSLLRRYL